MNNDFVNLGTTPRELRPNRYAVLEEFTTAYIKLRRIEELKLEILRNNPSGLMIMVTKPLVDEKLSWKQWGF